MIIECESWFMVKCADPWYCVYRKRSEVEISLEKLEWNKEFVIFL